MWGWGFGAPIFLRYAASTLLSGYSARAGKKSSAYPQQLLSRPTTAAKMRIEGSRFTVRVDQCRRYRLARRLAAPQHELEHRVEALALLHRRFGDRLGLLEAETLAPATIEHRRMAEDYQARSRPHLEMA